MSRLKFIGAFALAAAMSAVSLRAAAPAMPPDAIAADTVLVVHVDKNHFNPDQLQAANTAILGANANKMDDQVKKFKEKYDKAMAAGAEGVTIVAGTDKQGAAAAAPAPGEEAKNGNAIIYIQLKPGADAKAVEAMITDEMKPEDKAKTLFDQAGNYLAMHEKGQVFPVVPDAARNALFADALGTITDASIQIAFVPDQKTRDEMQKNLDSAPKGLKDAAPLLSKAKWMTLAINLGNAPGFSGTANVATDADAKTLTDTINTGLTDLKAQAANPGPDAGIMAIAGPLVGQLIDGLKPATNGTQVTVSVKTESLKLIAGFAAQMGLLGGAGGGGSPAIMGTVWKY